MTRGSQGGRHARAGAWCESGEHRDIERRCELAGTLVPMPKVYRPDHTAPSGSD
jgi:hypothetical protein